MYLVIYLPAFYIVVPAFFLKCLRCGPSAVKNAGKYAGKKLFSSKEEEEGKSSTQAKDSLMEDEEDELAYNLYSPHEDKPWRQKCLGNLDEWQPFQQQFYEDWW